MYQLQSICMENKRNSKVPTVNSGEGSLNPITGMDFLSPSRNSPLYDPYSSGSSGSMSSTSPLRTYAGVVTGATARSPVLFSTPVKLEEDVIVMDGFPVLPNFDKTTPNYSFNGGSSNSPGSGVSGVGTDNSKTKLQMCRYWEKIRHCRFGSNCRFAHITDDLRSLSDSANNKLEIGKPYLSSGGSTWSPNGTKLAPSPSIIPIPMAALPTLPLQAKPASEISTSRTVTLNSAAVISDWTPEDDGIEVTLPFDSPGQNKHPKEAVDAHIRQLLYGKSGKPRLPVFKKFCPE